MVVWAHTRRRGRRGDVLVMERYANSRKARMLLKKRGRDARTTQSILVHTAGWNVWLKRLCPCRGEIWFRVRGFGAIRMTRAERRGWEPVRQPVYPMARQVI
jgi:hypothetical protein